MCSRSFVRKSWSWSSFFSFLGASFLQRTMTTCVASLLRGDFGHSHRLFLLTGTSMKNTPKNPPRPEILDPQKIGCFSGISGVFSRGSRLSGRGTFFRFVTYVIVSWQFRVRPCRVSVAGRGVLNERTSKKKKPQDIELASKVKIAFKDA